ncbi:hypothetical protein C8A05DRAFT_32274 [Staphylotrichum tortipilum]|uniref:Uncharacterized protein n=1 Tax=Staphylotrichum tortipilum TaxID=2831512 RepID=A0AAN6RVH0_9PEZI|nr:hypothetical protein C8A05DRAFT_32274 [Staphylotrichum longicolle]
MARIPALLFLLAVLATLASANVPSFCKCTCFQNSTIIPLGPQQKHDSPSPPGTSPPPTTRHLPSLFSREASSSCTQCNRAFCLKYNLPICKDAEEKDIKTWCFQRDSPKDRVIVWGFLLGTAGLLGWAGARRAVESVRERRRRLVSGDGGRFGGLGAAAGGEGSGAGGGGGRPGWFRRTGSAEGRGVYNPLEDEQDGAGQVGRGPG